MSSDTRVDKLARLCHSGSVADIVVNFPELRGALDKLRIDYCCGGHRPFAEVVQELGLNVQDTTTAMLEALKSAVAPVGDGSRTDWSKASAADLVAHILATHHPFTREALERIDFLLGKVQVAHAEDHGEMLEGLRVVFDKLSKELYKHMVEEEERIFPAAQAIDAFLSGRGERPSAKTDLAAAINDGVAQHEEAGRLLKEMRAITDDYKLPVDACRTFITVFELMETLEGDLHQHIHLENNILFPRAIQQESILAKL